MTGFAGTPEDQKALAGRCNSFVEQGGKAIEWINDPSNEPLVGPRKTQLERGFRRSMRRAEKLGRAASSNMAVSVFGPSQNGKSFLVSVLARPENKPLVADFDDPNGKLSYIRDVNPAGEGESTGLVTRFTMSRPQVPAGHPIELRLLTAADLVQTLANTFFMDGDQAEEPPSAQTIGAHLARFSPASKNHALDEGDVWEIADYIDRNFRSYAYAGGLARFWEEAATLAPKLPLDQLGDFFSIVWGGYDEFTQVFDRLIDGLALVNFATVAYAPMAALVPRETSIIDVAQLYLLDAEDTSVLNLQVDGRPVALQRSVASALTAEFVLPMQDLPDPMFDQTDLLDFPGARNRFADPLPKTFVDPEGGIGRLILRGKVAYLFDRYVEDQKINAMLLCVKDSNMETIDLPRLIENWIGLTQGTTPEQRAKAACILFFVLTFFDKHLVDSAAASEESFRFQKRVDESLVKGFRTGDWIANWTPGQKFTNCYWMRNPNYPAEPFFLYDRDQDPWFESANPEKASRLAELKSGCLAAPLVQSHFAEPEVAWTAAMTPNDGGVSYLKDNLRPVCSLGRKLDQIEVQLVGLEEDLANDLGPFYVSDDLEERRREKQEAVDKVIDGLEVAHGNHSFAALMSAMMVDQEALLDAMSRVPGNIRISATSESADTKQAMLRPRREVGSANPAEGAEKDRSIRTMGRAEFQAHTAMRLWMEGMDTLKTDPHLTQTYGLSAEAMSSLATELLHAAQRDGLEGRLQGKLDTQAFGLSLDRQAQPASILAAEEINRFVSALGFDRAPLGERPVLKRDGEETGRPIFAPRPDNDTVFSLPEVARPAMADYWQNWVFALDKVYDANALHVSGGSVNTEQNAALGQILHALPARTQA